MSIIRTVHNQENPFVQINKKALWDQNLPLPVVGLWARLLSRPDDWELSSTELSRSCKISIKQTWRYLKILIEAGYAYRDRARDEKGHLTKVVYYVFEGKTDIEEFKKSLPRSHFPLSGSPLSGLCPTTNIDITKTEKKEKKEKDKKEKGGLPPPPPPPTYIQRAELVSTTEEEHAKLVAAHGEEKTKRLYERLSNWRLDASPRDRKKNSYRSILNWVVIAEDEAQYKAKKHAALNNPPPWKESKKSIQENKVISAALVAICKDTRRVDIHPNYLILRNLKDDFSRNLEYDMPKNVFIEELNKALVCMKCNVLVKEDGTFGKIK